MILTVTLNAALDITYRTPALVPHGSHHVTEVSERPGGKGLNVARVLAALGHETVVTGFAGGRTGDVVRELLDGGRGTGGAAPGADPGTGPGTGGGVGTGGGTGDGTGTAPGAVFKPPLDALVPIAGSTRRTIAVVDAASGDTTQLNEPGPTVSAAEWAAFLASYDRLLGDAEAVALCGSLPPGIHVGAYGELIRRARAAGVTVLLDTSGEPLRRGIGARPDLVKPNADELAQLTGAREPLRAARGARRRGAHAVVASLGPDGVLAATPEGTWQASPPAPARGNPTGAGDSAVAGLLSALVEGLPWPDRLTRAVALSAATVLAPTAGEFDAGAYEDLLARVAVTEHLPA
ncbi:1-phosphofructokinase family hexose kinase [Streptomyces sp. NPDC095613]|uniref:1-phosphofructokinase family hexose kinase n=1 Tax=Streptomyces sp. NPDC095613 TaxID=3155540 RepID=UPI003317FFF9